MKERRTSAVGLRGNQSRDTAWRLLNAAKFIGPEL
jgi:hypothetical protein